MTYRPPPRLGTVTAFDPERGLGTVTDLEGVELPFHCTAIAGGSRTVDVGTRVAFVVAPGHLGGEEARGVTPIGRD